MKKFILLEELLLLLISTALAADINVRIDVSRNESERQSQATGSQESIIKFIELETFQLYEGKIKDSIKTYFGRKPDDVYVKSRTPWGDLYKSYDWPQIARTVSVVQTEIFAVDYHSVEVMTVYINNTELENVTKKVAISKQVENTVSSKWLKHGDIAGLKIHYDINIKAAFKDMSFNYDSNWGETVNQSQLVTVGSDDELEVPLKSGQRVKAVLKATKGEWKVKIDYDAALTGSFVVNYGTPFKGHHFYKLNVERVLPAGGLSPNVKFSEVITVDYYSDYEVVVQDVITNDILDLSLRPDA